MRKSKLTFTLIEMLVVIAIISILASMLAPALVNAQHAAKAIACSSNLKNLSTAETMYSSDYKLIAWNDENNNIIGGGGFWLVLANFGYFPARPPDVWSWEGYDSAICPAATPTRRRYYNQISPQCGNDYRTDKTPLKRTSQVKSPSRKVFIADSDIGYSFLGGGSALWRWSIISSNQEAFDPRHKNATNAVMFDGHVEVFNFCEFENGSQQRPNLDWRY